MRRAAELRDRVRHARQGADGRYPHDRRRRRLDRLDRSRAGCCASARRAPARPGPGLLRTGRHGADADRREPRARPAEPGQLLRRRDPARRRARARGASSRLAARARADRSTRRRTPIIELANHNMVDALSVISVEQGIDPREFALVAFGGAGPLHAAEIAAILGVRRVLVPPYPGTRRPTACSRPACGPTCRRRC